MKWQYHIEVFWQAKKLDYFQTKLKELGEEGWELVLSVDRDPTGEKSVDTYFVFKRPITK
jgi:hypothetical protein